MEISADVNSGVSWGAVIAGAFVTAALALILLALGAGFGLEVISPWSHAGVSATTIGAGAIIWLIFMEAVSSAMGGWLAGRLRTTWRTIHTDEVHFRDTANGFIVWAVALVLAVTFFASAAVSVVGREAAGSAAASNEGRRVPEREAYYVDRLFRSDHPAAAADAAAQAEAGRIFAAALMHKDANQDDLVYLAQLVAAKTGLNQADAAKRVSDTLADAREAADAARKNVARALLWIFIALLVGAFCASYAATIGGRQRDHVRVAQL